MPKSLLMMDPADDLTPSDLLYLVEAAAGLDRDRRLTLGKLLKGFLRSEFQGTGDDQMDELPWAQGQPSIAVPAWYNEYPSGTRKQGWLNLKELVGRVGNEAATWTLSIGSSSIDLSDIEGDLACRITGTPTASRTMTLSGTMPTDREALFWVGPSVLPFPCLIKHGATTLATLRGGELVRVHFSGGGSPLAEVINVPEITLQSAKVWGGTDTRILQLQDDTINSVFDVAAGGLLTEGVAGLQLPRRSTAILEAITGVHSPVRSHFLTHEHGGVFERIPVVGDTVSPWWLRVDRQRCRLQDKVDARAGAGSLTTAWKDLTVSEVHFPEFSSDSDALIPPGIPTELTVFLTMLATAGGSEGFETTRDNLEFQFVWAPAGAAENLVWPGEILSSTRFGSDGSNSTWVLRFHGIQAGILHVPQFPAMTGPDLDCWAGNFLPGGYIQARVKSGTATHSVVGGAWIDFNLRERLPKDYGYRESV